MGSGAKTLITYTKLIRTKPDEEALARTLGTLGRFHLASNLNQIAKASNQGALPVSTELETELAKACADIWEMREALISALGVRPGD